MKSESSYFKLGLFVITGVALFVGGVVVFGAGALWTDYVTIETATTSSVQGLDVGAAVKFNGVSIGKVGKIEMARAQYRGTSSEQQFEIDKYIVIEMNIRRDQLLARDDAAIQRGLDDLVKRGLRARMASSGLTGPAYLEIVFLDPEQYPATPPPWKPNDLFMPSAPNTMSQIVSGIESIVDELKKANVGRLVGNIERLIDTTEKSVEDLKVAELREKMIALMDEAKATTVRVKQILDKPEVDETMKELPQIATRARETMDRINQIVHDPKLQETIDALQSTASSAAPAAAELRIVLREVESLIASQRQDLESIVLNLRRVLENTNAITQDAKQNPSRILFGEPPPRINPGDRK